MPLTVRPVGIFRTSRLLSICSYSYNLNSQTYPYEGRADLALSTIFFFFLTSAVFEREVILMHDMIPSVVITADRTESTTNRLGAYYQHKQTQLYPPHDYNLNAAYSE